MLNYSKIIFQLVLKENLGGHKVIAKRKITVVFKVGN